MFKKIKEKLLTKEMLFYIIFGILTTLVSIATFYLFGTVIGMNALVANVISWILAVAFAYVTNKLFVFDAKDVKGKGMLREAALFVAARLFSLGVEEAGLALFIYVMHMDQNIAKIILQVIVVILNYILSKFIIFRKKKAEGEK